MFGKNRIVNKHGLKMVGLKKASGETKRIRQGIIFWDHVTGHVKVQPTVWYLPKQVADDKTKYKAYLNSVYGKMVNNEIYKEYLQSLYRTWATCSIIYEGPMKMQEIADAIYAEYREEMAWRETAEENGWRVKE